MKGVLVCLLFFFCPNSLIAQETANYQSIAKQLLDQMLWEDPQFMIKKPARLDLSSDSLYINAYMAQLSTRHIPFSDTTILKELIKNQIHQKDTYWTSRLVTRHVLVDSGAVLNKVDVLSFVNPKPGRSTRKLKNRIKEFNKRYDDKHRNEPIAFSWPVLSNDQSYAMIKIDIGSSGWAVQIYRNHDGKWTFIKDFVWAFSEENCPATCRW